MLNQHQKTEATETRAIRERSRLIERLKDGLARVDEVQSWANAHERELRAVLNDEQVVALHRIIRGLPEDDDVIDAICELLPDLSTNAATVVVEILAWRGLIGADDNGNTGWPWGGVDDPTPIRPAMYGVDQLVRRVFRVPFLGIEIPLGQSKLAVKTEWSPTF